MAAYNIYKNFKKIVDPDGSKGHLFVIFSILGVKQQQQNYPKNEKFNRDYIKISYTYKDKPYFYLLKVKRGVTPLLSMTNENGDNVMDELLPYLGPNLDCHNTPVTPMDFGYKRIVATTVLDDIVTFEESSNISF
jgi:hypothetical protein